MRKPSLVVWHFIPYNGSVHFLNIQIHIVEKNAPQEGGELPTSY